MLYWIICGIINAYFASGDVPPEWRCACFNVVLVLWAMLGRLSEGKAKK